MIIHFLLPLYARRVNCALKKEFVIYFSDQSPCCGAPVYRLKDGRIRCSRCRRRYGLKRLEREYRLMQCFCDDLSARRAAQSAQTTYATAKKSYDRFRRLLLPYLEHCYTAHRDEVVEYDEYLYLDHSKRRDKRHIFDAHNFLTFDYGGKVYTILMPPLGRYKHAFLHDGLEDVYYEAFSRFLKIHRIARLRSLENTIVRFWRYFDEFMKKYKGIEADNFIYYLKEAEFKFNHPNPERAEVLRRLLYGSGA
ncbi:MAG: transposase [Epsilonproteobacteria bacterium]|nr:transposase [Campylobacterota bacterium]